MSNGLKQLFCGSDSFYHLGWRNDRRQIRNDNSSCFCRRNEFCFILVFSDKIVLKMYGGVEVDMNTAICCIVRRTASVVRAHLCNTYFPLNLSLHSGSYSTQHIVGLNI